MNIKIQDQSAFRLGLILFSVGFLLTVLFGFGVGGFPAGAGAGLMVVGLGWTDEAGR